MDESIAVRIHNRLDETDLRRNSTLQSLSSIQPHLEQLVAEQDRIETIVDLGCGTGAFVSALGQELEADDIHGVEINESYGEIAADRGVKLHNLDLDSEPLPFDDGEVDVVLAFGLLEHLRWYDHVLTESNRVLRDGGTLWVTVPNLGSYVNRVALLFGYQPRNIELSDRGAAGILPMYPHEEPLGHVHAPTRRALVELVEDTGFRVASTVSVSPYQDRRTVRILDSLFGWHPSLARRIALLAHREDGVRSH